MNYYLKWKGEELLSYLKFSIALLITAKGFRGKIQRQKVWNHLGVENLFSCNGVSLKWVFSHSLSQSFSTSGYILIFLTFSIPVSANQ